MKQRRSVQLKIRVETVAIGMKRHARFSTRTASENVRVRVRERAVGAIGFALSRVWL